MIGSLLIIVLIIIMGVGIYYQVKQNKRAIEIYDLRKENLNMEKELFKAQIKTANATQHYYQIAAMEGEKQ